MNYFLLVYGEEHRMRTVPDAWCMGADKWRWTPRESGFRPRRCSRS
jgi:hypothetical protein